MICTPCKQAGKLNGGDGSFEALAEALHMQCESPNCPCQHKTGQYINTEALNK